MEVMRDDRKMKEEIDEMLSQGYKESTNMNIQTVISEARDTKKKRDMGLYM